MVDNGDSGYTRGLLWGHHHMMGADRRSSRRVMVLEQIELPPERFGRVGDWDEIWPLVSAGLKKEEDDDAACRIG